MLYQRSEPFKTERVTEQNYILLSYGAAVFCISRKNILSNETSFWSVQVINTHVLK